MEKNLNKLDHIKKIYSESFLINGDSPNAVQWPKGRQKERFDALCKNINTVNNFSIVDFGCGLAHLKDYLDSKKLSCNYIGVDIVSEFLEANKLKHSNSKFFSPTELLENNESYDYIVASGTFSILYESDREKHKDYVLSLLKDLFKKSKQYLSGNFMTDQVDFIQETAFHINPMELYYYCSKNLSKRITLDQSYMPYEFTITVWKDDSILRPDNMYNIYE